PLDCPCGGRKTASRRASEGGGAGLESAFAEEHLQADADAPARCAVLRRIVLRPGDAWAQFEHQPFAQNLLAKDGAQAVFAKRDGRIELTAGERLDRDGALARQLAIDSKRGVAAHALGAL